LASICRPRKPRLGRTLGRAEFRSYLLSSQRRVKRRRALRARNPPRDNPADGVPMVHLGGTPEHTVARESSSCPSGTGAMPWKTHPHPALDSNAFPSPEYLLLHSGRHPDARPGGFPRRRDYPRRPSIRADRSSGQSLFTAYARRQSVEAWVGAHPSDTRFLVETRNCCGGPLQVNAAPEP
jgi:hypothetical protein